MQTTKVPGLKTSPVKKMEKSVENTRRVNRRWSEEEEQKMLKLVSEKKSHLDIGQELDRTEKAIGLRLKHVAVVMLNKGTPIDEIVEATGLKAEEITPEKLSFVSRKMTTNGNEAPRRIGRLWTQEEEEKMLQLLHQGKSRAEVGEVLDRTETALVAKLKKIALSMYNQNQTMEEIWTSTGLSEKEVNEKSLKKTSKKSGKKDQASQEIQSLEARLSTLEARLSTLENRK